MLVRFNKRTIVGGTIYTPESGEVELANDIADQVVAAGNGVVVGFGVYSNEARFSTDSSGNVTGLVGPGGKILPYVGVAERALLKNGQPYGITRAVQNPGKLVARFVTAETVVSTGTPAIADHTGFDGSGAESGVVSVTGQPNMIKMTPSANTVEGFRFTGAAWPTTVVTTALNGKLMLVCYIESKPATATLTIEVSTEAGGAVTNALNITFNSNQLREGWNYLKFVMRDPVAYQATGDVTEYHPYGVSPSSYGTKVDTDIVNDPITRIVFSTTNMLGGVVYFDSVWTDFVSTPQVVLGCDAFTSDLEDYALPVFESYGWVGYVATPVRVYSSGSMINTDFEASAEFQARADVFKRAGWDFINHTVNHVDMTTLTDAQIAYEILQSRQFYASMGLNRGQEFYASPQSKSNLLAELVIRNCGMKLQRHAKKANVCITPWGVDNASHVGASDISSAAAPGYTSITNGAVTAVSGLQKNSKLRILTDVMIAYGDTWFPFWHYITVLGDSGSGEDLTGDNLYMTKSAFELWMAYVHEKDAAGSLRVLDGVTGFYYGVGR